jgi:hypothetical protein
MKATPVVVTVESLFVAREEAARILCTSTSELDKLRASSRIVARRLGRKATSGWREVSKTRGADS